ncbi:hypothetical protein Glove_441g85 [Diversispora epigaea]|uniref:Galactose oxidase n=1 Tax=Diversispora epigaea TaxID=1348612 RepID=A0A397GR42_9GLOM|nr:hypothetical protein Glove_441g85 [Diversispora epigaea]
MLISGWLNTTTYTLDLFYLDLSKPFDNNNLTWTLISEGKLPAYTYRSTAVLSLDNSTIYLYGGFMRNKNTFKQDYSNLVYTFDYPTTTWSTPLLGGNIVPPPRQDIKGIIDNSGKIYIFGGFNATNTSGIGDLYNDMNILDTVSNTWTNLSTSGNLPTACEEYSANILPNGIIVYIGGVERVSVDADLTFVNMKKIKLFNTNTHEWSQMNATGDEIDPRWYFSSVLTSDGYIIIFGGSSRIFTSVSPDLAVLDTNKNPFDWSIPSNSKVNSPPSIYGHTANLYNDHMIITFGFNIDAQLFSSSSQAYLYNIKSNEWVTTFDTPDNKSTTPTTNNPSGEKSSKSLAIGFGTGLGVAFLISCILIIIFIVRRIRQRPSVILKISGSNKQ